MAGGTRKKTVKEDKGIGVVMKLGNKIVEILAVDRETLCVDLRFKDGFRGTACLKDLFMPPKGLTSEILKGGMFTKCFVESGALAWPNGLEFCPDAIRQWIAAKNKPRAA